MTAAGNWRSIAPPSFPAGVEAPADCQFYVHKRKPLRALVSRDGPNRRWHLSVSYAHKLPRWEELRDARYELVPDAVYMAQILPPRSEYVNCHPYTLHVFEIDDPGVVTL